MIGNSSLLAAVLTVVSVVSLSLLSLFCLRCKRKSKVIHEEHQIYNPQMFEIREDFSSAETESLERTYVAPLPVSLYENEQPENITDADPSVYANISTESLKDDEDDYENAEFLGQVEQEEEDDEPDYVNENGD